MRSSSSLLTNFILASMLSAIYSVSIAGSPDAAARLRALKGELPPTVSWSDEAAVAPAVPELIMVTESYCGPCQTLKRSLKKEGINYRTISIAEARTEYNRTVRSIPYLFYVRADGIRVGSYGAISGSKLREFAAPTRDVAAGPKRKARRICRIGSSRTGDAILEALATHLAVSSGAEEPVGGLADLHIPVSTSISDLMVLVSHKQELSMGRHLTISWRDLSLTSVAGRTKFLSPVEVTGRALGVTLTATLKEVYLHEDGRTVDVVIDGFPDLRVVFN